MDVTSLFLEIEEVSMWTICSLSDDGYDPISVSLITEAATLPPEHLCCFLSRKLARGLVPRAVFSNTGFSMGEA